MHRATWPNAAEVAAAAGDGDPLVVDDVAPGPHRDPQGKSDAKAAMRTEVAEAVVSGQALDLERVRAASDDLKAAGRVQDLNFTEGDASIEVSVTL